MSGTYKNMYAIFFLASLLFLSSCYSYRIATHAQPGTEISKPVIANVYFWGLLKKPVEIHTPICDSLEVNGVAEVTVTTNLGYALITVLTLGIWSPVKVQWKCSKPCQPTGTL
jgi:hypothetical protein